MLPTLNLTLSPTNIPSVVIPVIDVEVVDNVPEVEIELNLIVAIPVAVNCVPTPEGAAMVTLGADMYPNPLFPIARLVTDPPIEIVAVAVAWTGDGDPKAILGATVYPAPIVAEVPTAHASAGSKETAVITPVIG